MADNAGVVGAEGGPPSDLGTATAVVIEKVNAAAPPAATPPVTPPAVATATPPAPKPAAAAPAVTPPAQTPPATPPVTPPTAKTLADTPPADDATKTLIPADWPDDWRQKLAGDDKKLLARLERMGSPKDLHNAYRALEQRLSSGEYKKALPDHYTEEELKDFRKSNGIPEKPDDYDVTLGNGFVWGEADKPLLQDFTAFAHAHNLPQDAVKSSLEWYTQQQQKLADDMAQRDESDRINGSEALRAEWGNNFKANLNAVRNTFEGEQAPLFDMLMSARTQDGRLLGNIPEALKFLSNISRELNPFSTLVPSDSSTPAKTAESRYNELIRMSADKEGPYWRGNQSAVLQAEQRELIGALIKGGRMDENGRMKAA